ncbi:APC family permease [Mycobacterium sp. CVI_P3]|uniref:APC family permease n=1 Tax=Mycobacterium pinniadriaticum TaxID=2994102 RepID=A0ABT3SAJ7_9MYCO|nr:APC family permease [Mycobacterium pinniadriaticum]MCX2929750.1 APC family permease [Mycobacterium pinniadriaticum]MCX2936174.1 APC family permease [Mycobacterium pinniadriaticum]
MPQAAEQAPGDGIQASSLRRSLNVWSAVGVSVALMAPSMAININPQGTAAAVGRAVPLAFLLATVGVLLIAHTFVRLSQRFSHAGSVYAFVGATLGPRAGSVAGWLNAGTYVFYGAVTSTAAGIFLTDLIRKILSPNDLPDWAGYVFAWLVLAAVWWFSVREIRGGTTLLLVTEGLTIALILVVAVITLGKLITGHSPGGQRVDMSVFTVTSGTSVSTVFLGIVFGFLSFAGFEAAATLGEETEQPRRNIPRAILGTALFGGVFFVVVTAIEMMAFGTDAGGVQAFVKSEALIGDLAQRYVASWLSYVIVIGATFSAAACCLACVVGASRLIFALSRDGMGPTALASVHPSRNVPHVAATVSVAVVVVIQAVGWVLLRATPFDVFTIAATAGTLILLVAYVLATLGAVRLLFVADDGQIRRSEVVIPVLGLALLGYTLYRNVIPWPDGSALWGPGLAIAVLALVVIGVLVRPAAAREAGAKLMAQQGF